MEYKDREYVTRYLEILDNRFKGKTLTPSSIILMNIISHEMIKNGVTSDVIVEYENNH